MTAPSAGQSQGSMHAGKVPAAAAAIADASADAVAIVDAELNLVFFNRAFARFVGLRDRELREGHREVCHTLLGLQDCRDGCLARRVFELGRALTIHDVPSERTGLTLIHSAVALPDESGKRSLVMETFRDVTGEAQLQTRYREMLDAERRRSEALEREVQLRETQLDSSQRELEEVRSQLLGIFREEAKDLCERLTADVIALGHTQGAEGAALVNRVLRDVHTMKGTSATIGLDAVATLCHAIESRIAASADGGRLPHDVVDGLLAALDEIDSYLAALVSGESDTGAGLVRAGKALEGAMVPAAPAPPRSHPAQVSSFTRVSTAQVETLAQELAAAALELKKENVRPDLQLHFEKLELRLRNLTLLPLSTLLDPFRRAVWDHARKLGREAMLEVRGGEIVLDRSLVEGLRGPLTHLVRNAIDHGIEPPDVRVARGKPPIGRVMIAAERDDATLVITVVDDGGGVNRARIRAIAGELGLSPETDESLLELIWRPRFSTASSVTETAGRGVGLDAVRDGIARLWGDVRVKESTESGTTFEARIPLPGTVARLR